jgi:hypothetical protein
VSVLDRIVPLVIFAVLTRDAPAQTLLHHWDFDSAGVVRDVGEDPSADGVLLGGATVSGGILRLDGISGYVQFAAPSVPTSPPYTVALFARASAGANTGANKDFISQGTAGAAFYLGSADDGASMRAGDNWLSVIGASFIADGQFHHYALTMSATSATFFVDGVMVSTNAPFAGGAGGSATRFGRGVGSSGGYFNGDLDDVRIYDDALEAEEVVRLARSARSIPGRRP